VAWASDRPWDLYQKAKREVTPKKANREGERANKHEEEKSNQMNWARGGEMKKKSSPSNEEKGAIEGRLQGKTNDRKRPGNIVVGGGGKEGIKKPEQGSENRVKNKGRRAIARGRNLNDTN